MSAKPKPAIRPSPRPTAPASASPEDLNPFHFARRQFGYRQIAPPDIKGVGRSQLFAEQAFTLSPPNIEPPYKDKPSKIVPLPRKEEVVLIQRTGFWPLTEREYQDEYFYLAGGLVKSEQEMISAAVWFSGRSIQERVVYKPKTESQD